MLSYLYSILLTQVNYEPDHTCTQEVETFDLKVQNTLLQKERNVLLETIENLNREIREMGSKISSYECENQVVASSKVDEIIDFKEERVETEEINNFTDVVHNSSVDYGEVFDQINIHTDNHLDFSVGSERDKSEIVQADDDTAFDQYYEGSSEVILSKGKKKSSLRNVHKNPKKKPASNVCKSATSSNDNLTVFRKDGSSKLEMRIENEEDEESTEQSSMKRTNRRVRIVFQKSAKKFKCEECHFSCAHRSSLSRHKRFSHSDIVFEKRAKKFKCKECHFSCAHRSSLSRHVRFTHREIDYSQKP